MAIYVDPAVNKYGRMLMCHMIADTEAELRRMAGMIGVKRKWFQKHASFPHYDICKTKRKLAVGYGAQELTKRELVLKIRELRQG